MTAPQNDPELIHKLAAMTSAEFTAVVRIARGVTDSGYQSRIAETDTERRRRISDGIFHKTAQLFTPNEAKEQS